MSAHINQIAGFTVFALLWHFHRLSICASVFRIRSAVRRSLLASRRRSYITPRPGGVVDGCAGLSDLWLLMPPPRCQLPSACIIMFRPLFLFTSSHYSGLRYCPFYHPGPVPVACSALSVKELLLNRFGFLTVSV